MLAFAFHPSRRHDSSEKQTLLRSLDKAPVEVGVADVAAHQPIFNPQQIRDMLRVTLLDREIREKRAFLYTMQDASQ